MHVVFERLMMTKTQTQTPTQVREEEHLDHEDDDEGMSVGGETTIGEETQEDEAFEELPPWERDSCSCVSCDCWCVLSR